MTTTSDHRKAPGQQDYFEFVPHPTVAQMRAGLESWAARMPERVEVLELGRSAGGQSILAARVTDRAASDDKKQRVLLTACHAGHELNACTGLLHLIKWLIGDDADAVRYRAAYDVIVVPCVDPDGYASDPPRHSSASPYTSWTWDGPKESAESEALFRLMETFEPEAHVDVHGVDFKQQYMWETTGTSWVSALSRCHEHGLPRFIDDQVERQGYLIARAEQDAGRLVSAAPVPGAQEHYYLQQGASGRINAPCFSYRRYHSLGFIIEAGFDQSIVLRLRALLEAGLRRWRYQTYPGLPCDHLGIWGSIQLAAWGDTPARRRASRVALWRHAKHTHIGVAHPEYVGAIGGLLVLDPAELPRLGYTKPAPGEGRQFSANLETQIDTLCEDPRFNAEGLHAWRRARPRVPESHSLENRFIFDGAPDESYTPSPPVHGALVRLLVPYRDARITEVALDGHPLKRSKTDGYTISRGPGCVVHVAIAPEKLRAVHTVTCRVDPIEHRKAGFTSEDWAL